jgi:NADPH:quinone reductase
VLDRCARLATLGYDRHAVSPAGSIRVCEVTEFGEPEVLRAGERPWPVAAEGEVVVTIGAANVNPADIGARAGVMRRRMPELEPPFVLGWDLAGTVSEVGAGVSGYELGDRVVGMIPWARIGGRVGAYAQAAAVDPEWLAPLPDELDDVTAATIPLNALTARQALDLLVTPPGSTILVTGASGAVGGFAVQLAVSGGLRVLAVASDGDHDWVASLGADQVLPRSVDLAAAGPVDAVLDAVPIGPAAMQAAREGGVAVFTRGVGDNIANGREVEVHAPLVHVDAAALKDLTAAVADGRLRTRVARTLPLQQAAEAHRLVEAGGLRGKVVLVT